MSELEQYTITVSEAGRMMNKSAESIRAYERAGKLPAIKTASGMRLFRESDSRALTREQSTKKGSGRE